MQDALFRGVLNELDIRFSYTVCTDLCNEAVLRHNCDPLAAHVLCRALGSAVLINPLLKGDEKLSVRWNYGGAVKAVLVDVDSSAHVRGFISPTNLLDYVDEEAKIYGEAGTVCVIRSDCRQVLSTGTTDAALLDVVEDLSFYFAVSEQVETGMNVMVGFSRDTERPVTLCQGMMIQALPGCDLERFDKIRSRLGSESFRRLLSDPVDDARARFEALADALMPKRGEHLANRANLGPVPTFRCNCSAEKMTEIVKTLSADELQEIVEAEDVLNISCRFCGDTHEVGVDAIQRVLQEKAATQGGGSEEHPE